MADKENIVKENVPGLYYVDSECIDCDACRDAAPDHFKQEEDEGYSFVFKQPVTPEEIEACDDAIEECPVEAIGKDGDPE